jgi:hypothetical protein
MATFLKSTALAPLLDPYRWKRRLRSSARWSLIYASLMVALFLGLATQFYEGPFERWVARDLNGVFYAMVWCFGLSLMRPSQSPRVSAAASILVCFGIEFLQLWHPHFLEVWRAEPLGHLVLGSSFAWQDMPYYAVGGLLGGGWLHALPFRGVPDVDHVRPYGALV